MRLIFVTTCITLAFLASCVKKDPPLKKEEIASEPAINFKAPLKGGLETEKTFDKILASNLKFLSSLENEVLKILLQDQRPEVNQFEVIAFGFDKYNGVKTGVLQGFGCQKIAVRSVRKKFEVYSECTKPAKKLADISEDIDQKNHFSIVFLTSNWKVILGNAAGLNPERVCSFTLKDNKVQSLNCKNTVFSPRTTGLDINLLEFKIRKYVFSRNQSEELFIEGGQYKDLIENKKISLTVPMSGRISVIEKELKVKDDFLDLQNKLLGSETTQPDVKNQDVSGQKENLAPHTAEPEYIQAEQNLDHPSSGTAQTEVGEQPVQDFGPQNGEEQQPPTPDEPQNLQQDPSGGAAPSSVPVQPQPNGR